MPPTPGLKPSTSTLTSNTQTPLIDAEKLDYLKSKHQLSKNWKHQPISFLQGAFLHCHRLMMLAHDNACVTSATTEATNSVPIPTTPVYPSHR